MTDGRRQHLCTLVKNRLGPYLLRDVEVRGGEERARVDRHLLITLLSFLRRDRDAHLDMLVDLFAVDHGPGEDGDNRTRYAVHYRLRSSRLPYRLTLHCVLPEDDPTVPSVVSVFGAAHWYERELYDLFGILPDGHPNVRRLLLYPGFAGHPGRRDYPRAKSQPLVPLRRSAVTTVVVRGGES